MGLRGNGLADLGKTWLRVKDKEGAERERESESRIENSYNRQPKSRNYN